MQERLHPSAFGWTVTDDDCCQLQRQCGKAPLDQVYEMWQVTRVPMGYTLSHGVIDLTNPNVSELEELVRQYGYDSIDDFVKQCSPTTDFLYMEDGTLDREHSPSWYLEYPLLAEMIFECGAITEYCEGSDCVYEEYEDAENAILEIVCCPASCTAIRSKVIENFTWQIEGKVPEADERTFLVEFVPARVQCDEVNGKLRVESVRLPSGRWLEDIYLARDMSSGHATITQKRS